MPDQSLRNATDLDQWGAITTVAKDLEINRSTLRSAIKRGEIPVVTVYDGLQLVHAPSAAEWKEQDRKPGPKPKKSGTSTLEGTEGDIANRNEKSVTPQIPIPDVTSCT